MVCPSDKLLTNLISRAPYSALASTSNGTAERDQIDTFTVHMYILKTSINSESDQFSFTNSDLEFWLSFSLRIRLKCLGTHSLFYSN